MTESEVPNLNVVDMENLTKAVRVASKRGAFSMEENAQLLNSVLQVEHWINSFKQVDKEKSNGE